MVKSSLFGIRIYSSIHITIPDNYATLEVCQVLRHLNGAKCEFLSRKVKNNEHLTAGGNSEEQNTYTNIIYYPSIDSKTTLEFRSKPKTRVKLAINSLTLPRTSAQFELGAAKTKLKINYMGN